MPRCERTAEQHPMPQDGQGGVERVCAEHKKKPVVIATSVTRAAHCEVTMSCILCSAVPNPQRKRRLGGEGRLSGVTGC